MAKRRLGPGPAPVRALPELPENRALLAHFRERATPASGPKDHALGAWRLRTHPDNREWLASLVPGHPLEGAYGAPVLAFEGVAAAVAVGVRGLLVRLPALPEDIEPGHPVPPLTDGEWRSVPPEVPGLDGTDGEARIAELVRAALLHARDLSRNRPRHSGRQG
ncbi:hypothetical protein ACFC60_39620 [Kitasatospora purpeofusca]|uniref:hypothetical protein n=1 Tax=Kitasatospora purpeofusca TaxID=67352 RepID=UPI0035DB16D6